MRYLKIESMPSAKVWQDRDQIMIHACFQLLKDCVEQEEVLTHCNYEEHKFQVDEAKFLYDWWIVRTESNFKIVDEQDSIDDAMLRRLINIRTFLWT